MKSAGSMFRRSIKKQNGAALIMGLMLLLVMTLLALTASSSAVMQERIAGSFRDASLAFHATEAGGRWGAAWLQSLGASTGSPRPFPCASNCTASAATAVWVSGQYSPSLDWATSSWTYGVSPTNASVFSGYEATAVNSNLMVSAPPQFVLEEYYFKRDDLSASVATGVVYYRVIARGTGQRLNTTRVAINLLAKRFQ